MISSSEHSASSNDEDVLFVKKLPWRRNELNATMSELDVKSAITQSQSPEAAKRIHDGVSSQNEPTDCLFPYCSTGNRVGSLKWMCRFFLLVMADFLCVFGLNIDRNVLIIFCSFLAVNIN